MKNDEGDPQEVSYVYANTLNENLIQANIALRFSSISSEQHFNLRKK